MEVVLEVATRDDRVERLKMREWNMRHQNAGVEYAGVETVGVDRRGGKCRSERYGKPT